MTIAVIPLVGANTDRRTAFPEFAVGTPTLARDNSTYVYVGPAANAIAAGATCTVTDTFAVNDTAGSYTADTAFAPGEYGWVCKTASPL